MQDAFLGPPRVYAAAVLDMRVYRAPFLPRSRAVRRRRRARAGRAARSRRPPSTPRARAFGGGRACATRCASSATRFPPAARARRGPRAGGPGRDGAARDDGFRVSRPDEAGRTVDGGRDLDTVVGVRPGSRPAHRRARAPRLAAAPGLADLSGTAALLELARIFRSRERQPGRPARGQPPRRARSRKTLVLVSTSGGSGGAAGARAWARARPAVDRRRARARRPGASACASHGSSRGPTATRRRRSGCGGPSRPLCARRSAPARAAPARPRSGSAARPPLTVSEQGEVRAGPPGRRSRSPGERGPAPAARRLQDRLGEFGRAALRTVTAVDEVGERGGRERAGTRPAFAGETAGIVTMRKVLPDWAVRLLVMLRCCPRCSPRSTASSARAAAGSRSGAGCAWIARRRCRCPAWAWLRMLALVGRAAGAAPPGAAGPTLAIGGALSLALASTALRWGRRARCARGCPAGCAGARRPGRGRRGRRARAPCCPRHRARSCGWRTPSPPRCCSPPPTSGCSPRRRGRACAAASAGSALAAGLLAPALALSTTSSPPRARAARAGAAVARRRGAAATSRRGGAGRRSRCSAAVAALVRVLRSRAPARREHAGEPTRDARPGRLRGPRLARRHRVRPAPLKPRSTTPKPMRRALRALSPLLIVVGRAPARRRRGDPRSGRSPLGALRAHRAGAARRPPRHDRGRSPTAGRAQAIARLPTAPAAALRGAGARPARRRRRPARAGEHPAIGLDRCSWRAPTPATCARAPATIRARRCPGSRGTVAIAGHRTTYGAPFRKLDKLRDGDRDPAAMPYGRFTYKVERTRIVRADRDLGDPTASSYDRLVLSACHPLYSAAKRIVVFARLVATEPARRHGLTPLGSRADPQARSGRPIALSTVRCSGPHHTGPACGIPRPGQAAGAASAKSRGRRRCPRAPTARADPCHVDPRRSRPRCVDRLPPAPGAAPRVRRPARGAGARSRASRAEPRRSASAGRRAAGSPPRSPIQVSAGRRLGGRAARRARRRRRARSPRRRSPRARRPRGRARAPRPPRRARPAARPRPARRARRRPRPVRARPRRARRRGPSSRARPRRRARGPRPAGARAAGSGRTAPAPPARGRPAPRGPRPRRRACRSRRRGRPGARRRGRRGRARAPAQPTTVTAIVRTGPAPRSPPAIVVPVAAASASAASCSASTSASAGRPAGPRPRYASPGAAPIAARSESAAASARWPASAAAAGRGGSGSRRPSRRRT